jgi:hypothetical protein
MKADFEASTITIRKNWDEEWPEGIERQALIESIEQEFDVVEILGPYTSGTWSFVMRESDYKHAVLRINELIAEHVKG